MISMKMSPNSSLIRSTSVLMLLVLGGLATFGVRALAGPLFEDPPAVASVPVTAESLAETIKKIKSETDRTKPDVLREIAALKSREAVNGLLEAYDAMQTIFMKREVVRVLPAFDGVGDAEQVALQKLMDLSTGSTEVELRDAALDAMGMFRGHGKDFLRQIVTSEADDGVREKAMKLHVRLATKDDFPWYRELCIPKEDEKGDKEREKAEKEAKKKAEKEAKEKEKQKGKGEKEEEAAPKKKKLVNINPIRLTCYEAIASSLTVDELMKSKKDKYPKIRRAALEELASRGDKKTTEFAEDILKNDADMAENRVIAARILAKIEGTKAAPEFMKRASSVDSPVELRRGLAEILIAFNDEEINKQLIGDLGRGKGVGEKLFQVYVVRSLQDERVDKALLKMLGDKEKEVQIAVAKVLGERKYKDALPALRKMWEKGNKDREVMRAGLMATAMIRQGDATWIDELVAMTKHEDPELRSLAIDGLGNVADKSHLDKLTAALDDKNWSTRLAALEALERLHMKEAISPIILRMQREEGRMKNEFANALWRMTGQPYSDNTEGWTNWWRDNNEKFQLLSDADLEKVKTGEEEWRLRQTTRVESKFFGIRIISHRVIFIIDVSGSMEEGLLNDYRGKPAKSRMEVAKNELAKCVEGLDPGALFNIYTFSSDVEKWVDGALSAATEKNRTEASAFALKLMAGGGTNLYGAVQSAFADPDVDTIFIMSDGEPSVGDVIDPGLIRDHVAAWNANRKIVINTIAIGGQFQILEWLAKDSGGTNVKFE
ncbi:MAG: HEAT repeat domain-containing protein [Planctomycetota bacterium]|nr:HEAT repeat domain-containing protein [Planctomycetota bacterium]